MTENYMYVWKMTEEQFNILMTKGGLGGLQTFMFRLFGASCKYMSRHHVQKNQYRFIVKSNCKKPKSKTKLGTIISCGIWDYVEKKVGERVSFLVDYVETDENGNFLITRDEDEVFSVFLSKQELYGIEVESFNIYGMRKHTVRGCTYLSYRLRVTATVTNELLYERMIVKGIGRKRTYGNGLVSVGLDPADDDIIEYEYN